MYGVNVRCILKILYGVNRLLCTHDNANQKQTINRNIYTVTDNKLQSSSDLEDLDWDSTDSHIGELIIAYDNEIGNKILCLRIFYALYVKLNQENNGHLVYRLDKDQIVVTKNYQTLPVPEGINHTSVNDEDQYTQQAKEILRSSLLMSLRDKFLRLSLLASLQYGFIQSYLLVSIRFGLLKLSLLASLRHGFIQSSLLVSLQSNTAPHLHCYLYGIYSYGVSIEMSLLSYVYK